MYSALGCATMFCGSAYYVNFVQTPAMMQVKDTKAVRDLWKESFLRAKKYQVSGVSNVTISWVALF